MTTDRLQSLTDGVYAIAMMILVLNFEVPRVPEQVGALVASLIKLWPNFTHFWPGPVLFDFNILIVGLFKLLQWSYASTHGLMAGHVS